MGCGARSGLPGSPCPSRVAGRRHRRSRRDRGGDRRARCRSGKASTICWAVQAAVGCSVTLKWRTRRRWWASTTKTKSTRKVSGGNGEEIDRDEVPDMVGEERAPGLRRGCAPLRDQPGDRTLGHVDAELQEFAMDSGRTPERIGGGHFSDEGADLGVDRRAAPGGPAGEPGPVLAEAAPLPTQDGVGGHDDERRPPPGPDPGEPDPEEAIRPAQPGPGHRSLVHGELVAQGEVLQGELAMAAAEEGEESKQVEQEGDHRAGIVSGSEPTDQPLARRPGFGEGQRKLSLRDQTQFCRRTGRRAADRSACG